MKIVLFFSVGSELHPTGTQAATVSCLATEGQYVYFEDTLVNTTPVLAIDNDCVIIKRWVFQLVL